MGHWKAGVGMNKEIGRVRVIGGDGDGDIKEEQDWLIRTLFC